MDPKQKTEQEIQLALEAPYNKQYEFEQFDTNMSIYVNPDDPKDFLIEPEDCGTGA